MNTHGLQSNMGLASYPTEAENKKTPKATHTHKNPQNQQPTQKPVPDPIYKWE